MKSRGCLFCGSQTKEGLRHSPPGCPAQGAGVRLPDSRKGGPLVTGRVHGRQWARDLRECPQRPRCNPQTVFLVQTPPLGLSFSAALYLLWLTGAPLGWHSLAQLLFFSTLTFCSFTSFLPLPGLVQQLPPLAHTPVIFSPPWSSGSSV